MHIIPFRGKNSSSHYNLNLLYQDDKTYIMDNHLAAGWCWMQKLNPSDCYNLLHIDRHYDLLASQLDWWIEELERQQIEIHNISIEQLLAIRYSHPDFLTEKYPLFRWDNYLPIINKLYPQMIGSSVFATHKDGDTIDEFYFRETPIYELPENLSYWILEGNNDQWIINIDIDYFFTGDNGKYFQLLTDKYVEVIAAEISKAWKKIEVLTIALSPELCGGWEQSLRVAELFTKCLPIRFSFNELDKKNRTGK